MRTVEVKVFTYSELSDKAKQRVKNNWEYEDFWHHDRLKSMRAAEEIYRNLETEEEISGIRLYKFIQNNILPMLRKRIKYYKTGKYASSTCKAGERFSKIQFCEDAENLTGYCDDYSFLAPIFDFLKKPDKKTTNTDLMETDLEDIFRDISEQEEEAFFDEGNFAEHLEANGYEFTEDGERF